MEPILFRWMVYHKGKKRHQPVTLMDLLFSVQALIIWVTGSLIFTVIAMLLFTWLPSKRNTKRWLHWGLMIASRFLIYSIWITPKRIFNDAGKDWKKPAVIISNHQSHVDLAVILMQHPRLIVLTNDKVQRNPVYGRLARLSDYFPVSDGIDSLLPRLQARSLLEYLVFAGLLLSLAPLLFLEQAMAGARSRPRVTMTILVLSMGSSDRVCDPFVQQWVFETLSLRSTQ